MQGKRYFNLTYRPRYLREKQQEEPQENSIPKIPRSVPQKKETESPLGNFLIRLILCISIFSAVMLMKNSTDKNVTAAYNALKAWSECNYSIPEEYSIEKFVQAIKQGDILSAFSPDIYPSLQFPTNGNITVNYGNKDPNGGTCLGIMIESNTKADIFSSSDGTVTDVGNNGVIGNYITVEDNNLKIVYGCCDDILVSKGDDVDKNTVIAQLAKGNKDKYYMYMEVHMNGNLIDPAFCFGNNGAAS